jgi:hypothetical protein
MSQTYRIGSLNFTGSQAILSASLDVSGSGRFTNGLTVSGSFISPLIYDSGSVVKTVYGGNDIGLKLDFPNDSYRFGNPSVAEIIIDEQAEILGTYINGGIDGFSVRWEEQAESTTIGFSNTFPFTSLTAGRYRVNSRHEGVINGIDLDFFFKTYEFGHLSGSNQTKITVSHNDKTIILSGSLDVSGSATINDILVLTPRTTTPSNPASGSIIVSGSGATIRPYFWDGSTWTQMFT